MSPKAKQSTEPDGESVRFEAAVDELESIITRIESGELELDESMSLHKRGQVLLRICRERLEAAEQELKTVSLDDEVLAGEDPDSDETA
ncbi:MAG: exodeoxyribonuclease VII small subunit [Phycisphaerae bacterium]|nr:exodeoxyribonuclease VII small subunit [Phycisphaerae bacterium]|tara:strand:- start:472 stop:738 length:267 start_codon:yes stop_codon:yes gene_type:complete